MAGKTEVVYPEQTLPWQQTLPLGTQHVLAMFGSTVLAPLLMGFDPNLAIFFSGIGTLIFLLITRGHVPSYLGSSFAFIGPVLAAKAGAAGIPGALFGILVAAVIYFIIGAIVVAIGSRWIDLVMPPVVTGAIVMAIGLNLANVAGGMVMSSLGLAIITFLIAIGVATYMRGFPALLPILIGVTAGYLLALVSGQIPQETLATIGNAAWIGLPHFVTPVFDPRAALLIGPVAIVLVAENTGHIKAIGGNLNRNLNTWLGWGFIGDAVGTFISALGGGTGQTTYAENIGVMTMTRVYSIRVFQVAAVIAIVLGFCPKFAALIQSIPVGVMGGISILLFGLIAATGARIWVDNRVNFISMRNLIIAGVTVVIGATDSTKFLIKVGEFELSGIALATLTAIVLNQILRERE